MIPKRVGSVRGFHATEATISDSKGQSIYYKSNNEGAVPISVPIYGEGIKIKGFKALMERTKFDENGKYQGLRTGEFNLKDNEFWDINPFGDKHAGPNGHKGMNKDKVDTAAGKLAEDVATRHSI